MTHVPIRDLRNNSAEVLRRVAKGERLTVTKDGEPVASVVPLPRRRTNVTELLARRASLPVVNPDALRSDLDALLDPSL
ncbi:MAG: type II toxin-antitoxin system Phd/YefM family antitoxin [Propioniciclava sp.]